MLSRLGIPVAEIVPMHTRAGVAGSSVLVLGRRPRASSSDCGSDLLEPRGATAMREDATTVFPDANGQVFEVAHCVTSEVGCKLAGFSDEHRVGRTSIAIRHLPYRPSRQHGRQPFFAGERTVDEEECLACLPVSSISCPSSPST